MNLPDLQRFLHPIKQKIFYLVGKALLTAINNSGETGFYSSGGRANPQRVSMDWFGKLTDIERSQPYGLETYPVVGTAKAVLLSPDGTRSNAFAVLVQDDEYRPTDGASGDVILYNSSDVRVWLDGDVVKIKANTKVQIEAPSDAEITGNLKVTGNIEATGDITADSAATAISALDHFHLGNLGYNTDVPLPAGGGTPAPDTPPTWDSGDDTIDMGGQDIKNVSGISSTVGTHTHSGVTTGTGNTGGPN